MLRTIPGMTQSAHKGVPAPGSGHLPPGAREPGRVALITGASSGIGLELARELAARGFDVALAARRRERLEQLAADLHARFGVRAHVLVCDLADAGDSRDGRIGGVEQLVDDVRSTGLDVSVLVNNAGFGLRSAFASGDLATQLDMLRVNVSSLTELTRRLLPEMLDRASTARPRHILNVASTAAFVPGPFMAVYYASKAYVESLSVALNEELRGTGVTCTCLCPGPVRTEFSAVAGSDNSSAFKRATTVSAREVARRGVDATLRGRPIVIPGAGNRVVTLAARLMTRARAAKIVRKIQEPRPGHRA